LLFEANDFCRSLAKICGEKMPMQFAIKQPGMSTPCFFSNLCERRAALEKAGRSVCRACAGRLRGREYPLRGASEQSLYLTGRAAAEALDMVEDS
jgi:hypothetical protein